MAKEAADGSSWLSRGRRGRAGLSSRRGDAGRAGLSSRRGDAGGRRGCYSLSMMPAAPMPVPTHMVTMPYFCWVRRRPWTTVAARMALGLGFRPDEIYTVELR